MTNKEIERINVLAKKAKTAEGLADSEKTEQASLRRKYIEEMKSSLRGGLENVLVQNADGTTTPLKKKDDK